MPSVRRYLLREYELRSHVISDSSKQRVAIIEVNVGTFCNGASEALSTVEMIRAGGRTPAPPGRGGGGGSRMLRGLMLRMKKNFLVF